MILGRAKGETSQSVVLGGGDARCWAGQRGAGPVGVPRFTVCFQVQASKKVHLPRRGNWCFIFVFIICVYVCTYFAAVYLEVRGQLLGVSSVPLLFLLGIKLRTSGLAASGFIH